MQNIPIFLIEPDPVWGNMLKYRLSAARFNNVRLFPNTSEAQYQLDRHEIPHFLILETEGIGMEPFRFLASLREKHPSVRVIFFTRNADHRLATELLEAGATDFIFRSGHHDEGVSELVKNLSYLYREEYLYR